MRRALVSIGVDRVTGMTPLKVAAAGAKQVAEWGRQQGFDVEELTDMKDPVLFSQCFKATADFALKGVYDQIVIYFAGHGQLCAPGQEVWFLTDGRWNPNEAINLGASSFYARNYGFKHVVFLSDACRSKPDSVGDVGVIGGGIFPMPNPWTHSAEVDIFYAALPGGTAKEIPEPTAVEGYRAIYTDCLMDALHGKVPSVIEEHTIDGRATRLLSARGLKTHLKKCVPARASAFSIKLNQDPDSRVESELPRYLAEFGGVPAGATPGRAKLNITTFAPDVGIAAAKPSGPGPLSTGEALSGLEHEYFGRPAHSIEDPGVPEDHPVRKDMDRIAAAVGREGFETGTGFTIHGVGVEQFAANAPTWRFVENGVVNIGLDLPEPEKPALEKSNVALAVRFSCGTGACLAALPGYVGSVVVDSQGRVESVTYTPSPRSPFFDEYRYQPDRVNRRRAFAAVASKNGAFSLERREAGDAAEYLRMLKEVDPVLGIYAAYAYAQAGDFDGVRSVYEYMSSPDKGPVPFDVAMLAHFDRELPAPFRYPPRMPMLTQGWAILGRHEAVLKPAAIEARKYLIPSLWSTFGAKGMDILFDAMRQGEL